ncbi:ZN692 protein, partial [Rhinopomastus cyanomelas]|nr:ZN692 protein [Rhinopomastus cyanomelas]
RRQRRRALDSRRSKSRIRIGGHWEHWCRLKAQLGFSLHSQLAQFLLTRVTGGTERAGWWQQGEAPQTPLPVAALQHLVALTHSHGQGCPSLPSLQPPLPGDPPRLRWGCPAGHSFCW